jgi:hypothetical protein
MPQPSSELFRFAIGRATRPHDTPPHFNAPEGIGFVRLALERAERSPRPSLTEVAGEYLASPAAAAWLAGTKLMRAAQTLCTRLHRLPPEPPVLMTPCAWRLPTPGSLTRSVHSTARSYAMKCGRLSLHCTARQMGDAGVVLALACTARALALDNALTAGTVPEPGPLLRIPLALPLSAVIAAYEAPAASSTLPGHRHWDSKYEHGSWSTHKSC